MRILTAFNHKERLMHRLRDIYRQAEIFCLDAESIRIRMRKEIFDDPAYHRVPGWVRMYLKGYDDSLYANHWKYVKWVLPFNGVDYDNWDNLPEEGKELYRTGQAHGRHVYIKDPSKAYT